MTARLAPAADEGGFRAPHNWHQYPYPFIDGRVDPALLPVAEWREALRLACARPDAQRWATGAGEADDPRLVEELRTKILPAQGIDVAPEEVLVTASARQGLQLVAELLTRRGTPVLLEEPVDAELRRRLRERQVELIEVEAELPRELPRGAVVITSARRRAETAAEAQVRARALLAAAEDSDGVLVEHDSPAEVRESVRAELPLRALDASGRVVYIAALSPYAAPGVAPGMVVADARFIERARQLRRTLGAELPAVQQRAWAYFIGLGHYAALLARTGRVLVERRRALRDALNHYLHKWVSIETHPGSSAYWVRAGAGIDVANLAREAAAIGVLIEPVRLNGQSDVFRMGVSGLPKERIRPGVQALSRLIRGDPARGSRRLQDEAALALRGAGLRRAMAGATLLYNTVYGDPCVIEVVRDGRLVGRAGNANDDCDSGRWWIEDDRWCRQWQAWAYGEVSEYRVVIEGEQLRWYGSDGLLADTAVITRPAAGRRGGGATTR